MKIAEEMLGLSDGAEGIGSRLRAALRWLREVLYAAAQFRSRG